MNAPRIQTHAYYPTPIINQHTTWPGTNGPRFCTVATTLMFLRSSGITGYLSPPRQPPAPSDLNGVYTDYGEGRGDQIATYIKRHTTLTYVEFQGWSTIQLVDAQLTLGFPVPIGVSHWGGAKFHIIGAQAGHGTTYDTTKDKNHPRDSGWPYPAGHWGIVIGFDSKNYYINDPDSGTNIRWSRSDFKDHEPYMVRVSG